MKEIKLYPQIILLSNKDKKPRGAASEKQTFKRECLKNNGYTFDL
jgi:hypothetical protein